ncbi:unnamed protein product [Urochloa decumbens]|uniref:Uncharacterized protein n=1 Tax=Urochloa decumbens TaxID=240449 RepID=A0ABC9AHY0_9POAL
MYMEASAPWRPSESQLVDWTVEEPADGEVWAPAAGGLPVEYSSIDIYADICSLQPYVCSSSNGGQQQLVEYNYYAAATQQQDGLIFDKAAAAAQESLEVDLLHDMEMEILRCSKQHLQQHFNALEVFHGAALKFKADIDIMKRKIHRYPPSIRSIGKWCTVPKVVAIGPCHHGKKRLKHAENAKHVAAYYCIKYSGCTVQELYCAVVSAVLEIDARRLYSEDVMEGMGDDMFLPMMFYDACFLVMYMLKWSPGEQECNWMLADYIESNANDIDHDLMLLDNQIPWPVVDAIMKKYKVVPLEKFIEGWKDGRLLDRVEKVPTRHKLDNNMNEPPHLLGLLRFHIVGKSRTRTEVEGVKKMNSIAVSVSAMELAEMGINLKANETTELGDMDLTKKPIFFGELSMAPLSLNDLRASLLVNMAALELCTTPDFFEEDDAEYAECKDSAVCSYLRLLCMLVHRKEDVHQLRKRGILQGGAGLSNKNALDFFTSLQSLRLGRCCGYVMVQIESYRVKRQTQIKVYAFVRNNWKTIVGVFSAISVFASILSAIKSLKGVH